jgi:VIT1/CCC1 family predicted Fe2+/Mn2+ transporter
MAKRRHSLAGTQKSGVITGRVVGLGFLALLGGGAFYARSKEGEPVEEAERRFSRVVLAARGFSALTSGYHGFKRNDSVGWGAAWLALGALLPITPLFALAEGYAQRKGKGNDGAGWLVAAGVLAVGGFVYHRSRLAPARMIEVPEPPRVVNPALVSAPPPDSST